MVPISKTRFRIDGAPAGFYMEFAVDSKRVTDVTVEQPNGTLSLSKKGD